MGAWDRCGLRRGNAQKGLIAGILVLSVLAIIAVVLFRPSARDGGDAGEANARTPSPGVEQPVKEGLVSVATPAAAPAEEAGAVGSAAAPGTEKRAVRRGPQYTGKVLRTSDESPVGNALVRTLQVPLMNFSDKLEVLESVNTDAEGRFTIPWPGPDEDGTRARVLVASAEGLESRCLYISVEPEKEVVFRLGPGAAISGRVVTESGSPVAGASIANEYMRADIAMNPDMAGGGVIFSLGTSGEDGGFMLEGLSAGDKYRLNARAARYLPTLTEEIAAGSSDVKIVLQYGRARLYGKVSDVEGKPVKGAVVQTMAMEAMGGSMGEMLTRMQQDTTDKDGAYRFESLKPGQYTVNAMRSATNPMGGMVMKPVSLKDGEEKELDLQFPKSFRVAGKAINLETGQPLAGVKVSKAPIAGSSMFGMKMPRMGKASPEVLTGADGTFALEDVAPMGMGAILYHQPPKGFISAEENTGMAGTLIVVLNEKGEPNPVELRYRPTSGLGGIVYLPDGTTPAAEVRVSARPDGRSDPAETMTGKDGRFRVEVPPGSGVEVRATTEATVASVYTKVPEKGAPADVALTLQAYAIVSGTVKDGDGNPVKGINVSQHSRSGDSMIGFMRLPGMTAAQAISDVDGRYEITKLEPGEVTIQARVSKGFMMGPSSEGAEKYTDPEPIELTIAPGQRRDGVDFVLETGDVIEGVVLNEAREPVADATVQGFSNEGGMVKSQKSDAEGKFSIPGIGSDTMIAVSVSHPDYTPQYKRDISARNSPVEIVLESRPLVTLVAKHRNGSAVADYRYEVFQGAGSNQWYPSQESTGEVHSPDGTTKLEKLTHAKWRVEVYELIATGGESGRMGAEEFEMEKGSEAREIVVTLDAGRRVSGRVINGEEGPPVPDAAISVSRNVNSMVYMMQGVDPNKTALKATTDANGEFSVEPVIPGTVSIKVEAPGLFTREKVTVQVPGDRDPDPVTIVLVEGGSIYGSVIDTEGNPVANASIQVRASDDYAQFVTPFGNAAGELNVKTDAAGAYRRDELGPGAYTVVLASTLPGVSDSKSVQLAASESKEVNFDFSGFIKVTGVVRLNGKPFPGDEFSLSTVGEAGGTRRVLTVDKDGRYSTSVKPGRYSVFLQKRQNFYGGMPLNALVANMDIPTEPREQTHDLDLQLIDATVALVFPDEQDFSPGSFSVAQVINDAALLPGIGTNGTASSPSVPVKYLQPGQYKATFRSNDGNWYGVSETTRLAVGGENILVVDVKKPPFKERIGGWNFTELAAFADYDFDVSQYVTQSGKYEVIFEYESGNEALAIESAALLSNGREAARDAHPGWSGFNRRDHVYRLPLSDFSSGGGSLVRCRYKANGKSVGSIYLARE